MKNFSFIIYLLVFLSGCFGPKYISSRYFSEKHTMSLKIYDIPTVTHSAVNDHYGTTDPMEKMRKGLISAERSVEQVKIFANIDSSIIKKELEENIKKRVNQVFQIDQNSNDLLVEIRINSWGWIVPKEGFLGFLDKYQLFIDGQVQVFDLQPSKKLIAHTSFSARENIVDRMSISDTQRAIKKAASDASELISEFLWRSDEKK